MFDINLLAKPGTLENDKINTVIRSMKNDNYRTLKKQSVDKDLFKAKIKYSKSYLLILVSIGLFLLILGSILNHNKINQIDDSNSIDISILNLLNALQENNSHAHIDYIKFNNDKISFEINTSNENDFYNSLDVLGNYFNEKIRGIHKKNQFSILGDFPWSIKNDNSFTINFLDKEISDFSLDVKKEIYKDKLIIISGIEGVFELLNLILDLNLIDCFHIEIEEIQSLPEQMPVFQIIIY